MTSTLATRKQAAAIRDRMQQIRSELPYDVDDARERVKQLSDWKYHMSRHSVPILAAVAVAGFLVVPKKSKQIAVPHYRRADASADTPAKRGMFAGIAGAAMTLLLRQATSMAARELASHFTGASRTSARTSDTRTHEMRNAPR
ncbi:hypothetical protein N9N28_06790 [Rubripirellula amarantea]|nr:hypothetical protein [Rubripirellula amarantea]